MEVENNEDSLLAAEIVHIVEAAYKVYGPVLSQILHPTVRTELTRGTGFPQGLWVWHGDDVDGERFVVLYYLHGGGYCFFDGITSHLELVTRMIAQLQDELSSAGWDNVKVVAFILDYSLAPQAILPTQLEEAVEGYKYILSQDRYPVVAGDIVISGDSAGGALVLSLLKCLNEGAFDCGPLAGPACAHIVSPMLSLSRSLARGSYNFNRDFLSNCLLWHSASCALYGCPSRPGERHRSSRARVTEEACSFEWRQIRGKVPEDKQDENPAFTFTSVSRATFGGVPILVQACGSEGFLEEILHFVKMTDDVVTLEVYEDRFHIFPMLSWIIPQGMVAIKRWASFSGSALMGKPLPLGQHLTVCPAGSVKPHPQLDWDTAQSG
ncbi:hypothetical protein FOZ63_015455 [Perkinsus olseni]|nr:hypothetical protein FOZ63_015455 [Perkinsus olseni]